jgi:hypothetical protein
LPLPDMIQEAQRVLAAAEQRGIVLRLLGGLAVRFHSPSAIIPSLEREYANIDFMGFRKQAGEIERLFNNLGYVPLRIFNTLHAHKRLMFDDVENQRRVDIFLDVFKMWHRLEFKSRLLIDRTTVPLADLLATKLQVVTTRDRECRDIIALLLDHQVGDSDSLEVINGAYLAQLCSRNWGVYKTFTLSLTTVLNALPHYRLNAEREQIVRQRLQSLLRRIEETPRSFRWRIRARVGEKIKWYEVLEDAEPSMQMR